MTTIDATATRERATGRQKKHTAPSTAVARPKNGPVVAGTVSPLTMLNAAIQQNVDLEKLTQLTALYERWEANEAKKAFISALNAFKVEPPSLVKNKRVHFDTSRGATDYTHATLDNVSINIGKALSKHGLSHRWDVEQMQGGVIRVTCVLTHERGHSERVPLEGVPDTSGSKNSIQAVGSTVTYLQRYTLLAATGMAVQDQDDDGRGASQGKKPEGSGAGAGEPRQPEGKTAYTDDEFAEKLKTWGQLMADRKKTAAQIIATVQSKRTLTPGQIKKIRDKEPKE